MDRRADSANEHGDQFLIAEVEKIAMKIETRMPFLDGILENWKTEIGDDYAGYRNHVYRMVNFCCAQADFDFEAREKIMIAGCFHDLGIWTGETLDYLPPSIALAKDYLRERKLTRWIDEIELMIDQHHKLRRYDGAQSPLVEIFRRGDLVDFSLGFVKCGVPKTFVKNVREEFPNAGFHKCLLRAASRWFFKHPLNPLPILKW